MHGPRGVEPSPASAQHGSSPHSSCTADAEMASTCMQCVHTHMGGGERQGQLHKLCSLHPVTSRVTHAIWACMQTCCSQCIRWISWLRKTSSPPSHRTWRCYRPAACMPRWLQGMQLGHAPACTCLHPLRSTPPQVAGVVAGVVTVGAVLGPCTRSASAACSRCSVLHLVAPGGWCLLRGPACRDTDPAGTVDEPNR